MPMIFALNVDGTKHISIIVSFPFSLGNVISGDDEGEAEQSQKANIQSRRDNKRGDERQLWMEGCPWGGYAVIMLERAGELRCGAIRDRRIDWGRVQAQQRVLKEKRRNTLSYNSNSMEKNKQQIIVDS